MSLSADATPAAAHKELGEEVLLDYVTGSLDDASALMVAAYLALKPDARAMVDLMTDVGGVLLADAAPVAMDEGALEAVFARLDETGAGAEQAGSSAGNDQMRTGDDELAGLPRVIREKAREQGNKWSFVSPGVRALELDIEAPAGADPDAPGEVKLYRIEPGHAVLGHSHKGREITLVLSGAFTDISGRFGPGEICVATPDTAHRPRAENEGVCYALAITDAPLRLTGALGLVQRALGQSS